MKRIILPLFSMVAMFSFGQSLQPYNATVTNDIVSSTVSATPKTTACGPDTVRYTLAKATGLSTLSLNNATSATGVSQYYDAPQTLSISGVEFFAWKTDANGGITIDATVEIYNAGADSLPTGTPLVSTTVALDTVFGGGQLSVLRKLATFTPITVNAAYCVVVSNNSANNIAMVFSSYTAAPPDGAQEWLAGALLGPNWLPSYEISIGGNLFDADCLAYPVVSYDLTSSFTVDDPCFATSTTLTFTNTSSPILAHRMYNQAAYLGNTHLSYTWDFGDGSATGNAIDTMHTYASAGAYTATLTDTIYGWTSTCADVANVSLGGTPTAAFTSSVNGLIASFTNGSSTGPTPSYLWDFGDGNTSTQSDPSHTYAAAGVYTVCLVATDACGSDSTCAFITTVSCNNPIAAYTSSNTDLDFTFTNGSTTTGATTYLWDFGDGTTGTAMDETHTYPAAGDYTVCLTVTDSCGVDSVCQVVTATQCLDPVPGFTVGGSEPTFDFTNSSTSTGTTTYLWDFGDGNTSTDTDPTHTYTSNNTYTVCLTVTDSCGVDSTCQTVTVATIGLNDLSIEGLEVYPNPANGSVKITANSAMTAVELLNMAGQVIERKEVNAIETQLNTAKLANGSYMIRVRQAGDRVATHRLEILH